MKIEFCCDAMALFINELSFGQELSGKWRWFALNRCRDYSISVCPACGEPIEVAMKPKAGAGTKGEPDA